MPGNGVRYTDEVKDFARSIYKQSPETNTYEKVALVVSEKFGFTKGKPVPGTIGDWINKGAYSRKAYERTKDYRATMSGLLNKKLHKLFGTKRKQKQFKGSNTGQNQYTTNYERVRVNLKGLKGRNEMLATEYIEHWQKTGNIIEIISDDEWKVKCGISGEVFIATTKNQWHLDHILPESKGGLGTPENLQIVLSKYNKMKSDMTQEELMKAVEIVYKNGLRQS